jgi:hypothetical protein
MKFVGQLLSQHLKRYPRMELSDIYKLLHQATLGPGHAAKDRETALALLEGEAVNLGEGPADPVADPISPDGRLVRVHLRAYIAADHDLAKLADAFVETAQSYEGSRDKLKKFCACLGDLAQSGGIPFSKERIADYFTEVAAGGYPAVHHSKAYRDAYRPAYRVVSLDFLPALSARR